MSKTSLVFTIVGTYCILVTVIGIMAKKKSKATSEDYFLASRKVSAFVSFCTLTASFYSAYLFMGAVGFFYTHGFAMLMAVLYCATYGLWYWVLGGPIHLLGKKFGHSTPAELMEHYYESKELGSLIAIVLCVFCIPYLSMQYGAIGMAFQIITEGAVSYQVGAIILGGVACAYIFLGGFRSVAWTDVMQGIFFMAVAWGLGIYFLIKTGGVRSMFENIAAADHALLSLPGPQGFYTWGVWLSFMLLYSVLTALRPDTFQRAYAVENLKAWKKACIHTAWVLPVTYIITMFTSFGLRIYVPGLTGVETEQALIAFFNLSNPIMGVFLLTAAMAASMSTIDSMLLVTSQYLTEDIIKRYRPGKYTDKQLMHIGQLFTVILTIIAIIVTMRPPEFMVMITALFYGFGCLLWPLLGCIIWPRGTKTGSIASILTSSAIIAVFKLSGFGTYIGGIHFVAWGIYIGGIVYVVVSLMTSPPSDEIVEAYHGYLRREFWGKFNRAPRWI
jgi:SSS family solute:Na+ symporter